MARIVTENDFRKPEFIDAKPEDYEFDGDGQLVRKDRWKNAINDIRYLIGQDGRSYEISDVVTGVERTVDALNAIAKALDMDLEENDYSPEDIVETFFERFAKKV